jgi:amidophosphoribosyltransferase
VAKPDGRLTHDLDPNDRPPRDACGVFGVWSPGEDVAKLAYYGLYALQHRGQESAGIAVSDGRRIVVHKEMGLVAQVFDEPSLTALRGDIAVAHCRYSTTGAPVWANAQPTFRSTPTVSIALGHNGNLTNTRELAALLPPESGFAGLQATSDTDVLTELIAGGAGIGGAGADGGVEEASARILPLVRGAYSLVYMDENTLYAARDPQGFRPLVIGRLSSGWVVASETAALDIVGASFVREVEPGELISLDERGVRSRRFAPAAPKVCLFEYVYLARPDTTIGGRGLHATRVDIGRRLAAEYPASADLVIPVPESGTPAAIGYAEASGIPYGQGLVKNSYVGRTFIQPSQTIRQLGIRLKLNPLRDVIAGRRIVVVDDSIVRGNTQQAIVAMLREAGALEVHVRIASPPVKWPCFYGIDFASRDELIAGRSSVEEIRAAIGADSLGYVSLDGLIEATQQPQETLCRACFDGHYPVPVPENERGKGVLEPVTSLRRHAGMRAPAVAPRVHAADATTGTTRSWLARQSALARSRPVVLVVVLVTGVVVERVLVVVLGIRVVVVVGAVCFRPNDQLLPQPIKVCAAAVVLKLASNLNLLGLGSAAPHWLDPLERPEPCGPTMPLSLACVRTPVTHT